LVFEKSVIINDFRAIAHNISAREGGNTVCCNAMVRNRTGDNSVTYWFPWKHPMARRRGLEFGVFDQTPPPKMGSSARPYGPHRSIFFPPQNYHSQSIGLASPFAQSAVMHVMWVFPDTTEADSIRYTQYRLRYDTYPIIVRSLLLHLIKIWTYKNRNRTGTAVFIKKTDQS